MGDQFNWQIEEEAEEPTPQTVRRRWPGGSVFFWIVAVAVIGALIGSWAVAQERSQENEQNLVDTIQDMLDLGKQALNAGDGELYYSMQDGEPEWFAAQLRPANQDIVRAGLRVTNAEQYGETIRVNATWEEQETTYQQILFFEWRAGQLRQVSTDANFWGVPLQREEDWGRLNYYAVDDPWATSIANFVDKRTTEICADNCLEGRRPFTLDVRDDYRETAEPNQLTIPSPRLLGLDVEGAPSSRFWRALGRRIHAQLTPATIQFAVPPLVEMRLPYDLLAEQFMAENPGIRIEIVNLDSLTGDLSNLALEFDGAAIPPTEAMLAAGQVHDLTDYVNSDRDFDQADFYEQIWQGTLWHGRNWLIPDAAEMKVLYYDKAAYDGAEHPEPSSRWTWDEMAQDVTSIVSDQQQPTDLTWGFLDVGLDSLFSYAYNWNTECAETVTVFCRTPMRTENVAAALDWYSEMANQEDQMPNLTGDLANAFSTRQMLTIGESGAEFDEEHKVMLLLNLQGSERKAAIWVDSPLTYEFNLLLSPVGIVPFPGSDRFDGITPLWLQGNFISQYSERPLAVWQWLKFLSFQPAAPRFIPARPSVASMSGYWTTLPRPLGDVMRTAFPFGLPVTIEEQGMLTWEQVATVISGELSAAEAAQDRPTVQWFGHDQE